MAGLKVAAERCIGCFACEVACMQEHELPPGPRLIRVEPADKESLWTPGPMFRPVVSGGTTACVHHCPADALELTVPRERSRGD